MTRRAELSKLAIFIFLSLAAASSRAGRLTGSLTTGFDSFTEKYSIVERDTLDELTEFRTRAVLGYMQGEYLRNYLQIEAQSLIGEESIEHGGRFALMRRFDKARFYASSDVVYRTYREGSDYSFPNDLLRYGLRGYLQRRLTDVLAVRLTERLEVVDFEERTEFDYDYVRNHVTLGVDVDRDVTSSYRTAIGFATKAIPDSTEISYRAYTISCDLLKSWGPHQQIYGTVAGERRIYDDERIKSPYWALQANTLVRPLARGALTLGWDNDLESYAYDDDSDAFFDYLQNRATLLTSYFATADLSVGIGPVFAFFIAGSSPEDEYREYGAKVAVDYRAAGKLWLSASYEPGHRNYRLDGTDASEVIFSDFTYHRITVFASATLWRGLSMNVFVNHEPENHSREDDDASATLFSLDTTYSF